MAQLRDVYPEFVERSARVIIVGPEDDAHFEAYFERENLPFTGLPDPEHFVLKLYGQEVNLFKLGRMPAQILIDKRGMVRFAHYGHDMTDIPPASETLQLLDVLNEVEHRIDD